MAKFQCFYLLICISSCQALPVLFRVATLACLEPQRSEGTLALRAKPGHRDLVFTLGQALAYGCWPLRGLAKGARHP
jgi:hypothetical protein